MIVPNFFTELYDVSFQTATPVSSLGIGYPCTNNLNHILGFQQNRLMILHFSEHDEDVTDTNYQFYVYRHTNCTLGLVIDFAALSGAGESAGGIDITLGTGTTQSFTGQVRAESFNKTMYVPFGDSDSGWTILEFDCTYASLVKLSAFGLPKQVLLSTDTRVEAFDNVFNGININEGSPLAHSTNACINGIVEGARDAWDNCNPHIISWAAGATNSAVSTTSGSYTDLFADDINVIQTQKYGTEDTMKADFRANTWATPGVVTYSLRLSYKNGSTESVGLSNNSPAWTNFDSIDVDAGVADTVQLEARITSGSGTVYCNGFAGVTQ